MLHSTVFLSVHQYTPQASPHWPLYKLYKLYKCPKLFKALTTNKQYREGRCQQEPACGPDQPGAHPAGEVKGETGGVETALSGAWSENLLLLRSPVQCCCCLSDPMQCLCSTLHNKLVRRLPMEVRHSPELDNTGVKVSKECDAVMVVRVILCV